ncbi:STE3-domain-containing protein [Flagelloscypha sp. PMI_526]|nr:STE3-domain-containing protein [Flagelloscypha sp. PMI_526]
MPASNQVFSAFAFMSFFFVTIPLPWHLHSWNVGTVMYMLWTGTICLIFAINSVVWNENAINWAPVWCDISTRIHIGAQIGILCSSLCINRRLFHIAQSKAVNTDKAEKRKQMIIDLTICLLPAFIEMPLQYIVQGCFPVTLNTPPSIIIVHLPPLLISIASLFYCVSSIILFMRRKHEFEKWLAGKDDKQTALTRGRYNRLMGLAGIEALCGVPLSAYVLYGDIKGGIEPYVSWEWVHVGFSRVDQFPRMQWAMDPAAASAMEMSRWLFVTCGLVFFLFFGFASEARNNYWKALAWVAGLFGKAETVKRWQGTTTFNSSTNGSSSSRTGGAMPGFASKPKERSKRVIGDGLDFDESEFDSKATRSMNVIATRSRTESTYSSGSLTDIEDEKSEPMSAASRTTPLQPWETIALPQLQTHTDSSSSIEEKKISDIESPV